MTEMRSYSTNNKPTSQERNYLYFEFKPPLQYNIDEPPLGDPGTVQEGADRKPNQSSGIGKQIGDAVKRINRSFKD